uniref:Interferon-induced protein 44-like n=1 Tax=Erpetoichthys calabaricus TaxID=27687 RepID=A0A8C4SY78_ERPCA
MKKSKLKCPNLVPVTVRHLTMATLHPHLDRQSEKQLCMFFNGNVKFSLLYKGSFHGFSFTEIQYKCTNQGQIIMVGYLEDGLVLGGCMSKGLINQNTTVKDETAFRFSADQSESVKTSVTTVNFEYNAIRFDSDLRFQQSSVRGNALSVTGSQLEGEKILEELEVYRVEDTCDLLETPWRELTSNEEKRNLLKESVVSYKPPTDVVSQARVLLVGPVGAGKSSFISSVCSVFHGRVSIQAMVGTAARSFTTKFRSYTIKATRGGEATPLVLCDMMGLGETDLSGVKMKDVLQVIKGHVPEGYKFNPSDPISSDSKGYVEEPTVKNKIACVAFVLDASRVSAYPEPVQEALKELRLKISDLGVPQVALLTHTDEVCNSVAEDVKYIYQSQVVQDEVYAAGKLLGLPISCIVPVKNYSSELELNCSTDILILSAVDLILQYVDMFCYECEMSKSAL